MPTLSTIIIISSLMSAKIPSNVKLSCSLNVSISFSAITPTTFLFFISSIASKIYCRLFFLLLKSSAAIIWLFSSNICSPQIKTKKGNLEDENFFSRIFSFSFCKILCILSSVYEIISSAPIKLYLKYFWKRDSNQFVQIDLEIFSNLSHHSNWLCPG